LAYSNTTESPLTYSIAWNQLPENNLISVTDQELKADVIEIFIPLISAGTYTGTLTVKNANGCVSTGSVITIIVNPRPTIATTGTITSVNTSTSSQNASLIYTATTSNPVRYSINWNAAANANLLVDQDDTLFAFSSSGGIINNIQVPANVPAGSYSGFMTIYNGVCKEFVDLNLTINALPTIALAPAANTRCSTNDGSASGTSLSYTGTTGSPVTYSIVWDASPANNFVAVTDANLPTSPIMIAIPAGTIPSTYTGTLTVKDANGAVSSPGSVFTVTTNETPLITTTGTIASVVTNANSQIATLAYTGVTGNPISYFIDWNFIANDASLADQPSTPFAFSSSGGIINNIQVSANVPAGDYIGMMSIYNGLCYQNQTVYLTVNPLPAIVLSNPEIQVCLHPNTEQYTFLNYSATTGDPTTYSILWDSSPTNTFVTVVDATLSPNSILITVPAGTNPGTYTGTLTVKDAGGNISLGTPITIIANEKTSIISLPTVDPITASSSAQNATLAYSGFTGNPVSYSIDWNGAANAALLVDQGVTPFTFVASGGVIDNIYIPANVPPGTYLGGMSLQGDNNCSIDRIIIITINPMVLPTIALASSTPNNCYAGGNFAQSTELAYAGTTGNPITYSIVWDATPTNSIVPVTDEELLASPIKILLPTDIMPGIYKGTLTVKDANGAVSNPGSIFSVTIGTPTQILTNGRIAPVTTSSNLQNTSLTYAGTFDLPLDVGVPTKYYIDWDDTANTALLVDQPTSPYTFSASGGTINTIVIPANVPAGTYSGFMYASNEASCEQRIKITITINPIVLPTIALNTSAEDVCIDYSLFHDIVTTLGYTGTTGNPTTYSIVWDGSAKRYFEDVTDEMLPSSPITIKPDDQANPGTYTGTLTVKNANGTVSSPGSVFSVTVNYTPYILTTGTIASVSTSTISQNAELAYTESSENPTIYSIDWDGTANAALLLDQGDTPFTFPSSDGIINTIVIPANVPAGTYSGTMYISNGTSCIKSQPVSITINESAPTITLSTSAINICSNTNEQSVPLDYDATTGNPTVYSIVWDASPANTFAAVVDEVLQDGSIKIIVPAGTVAGTYTGTLTVKNTFGGVSSGTNFTVTVNETPAFVSSEPIAAVYTSTNAQTTTLTYTSSLGGATGYSINWNGAANAAFLQDQPLTAHIFKEEGDIIDTIVVSANAQPGTYQGTMILNSGLCKGVQAVSITIEDIPLPTIALGAAKNICNGALSAFLPYKGTTGDPITYSIVWDASPANSFVAVTDATLPDNFITIDIPTGTAYGVYTGTLTVKNAFGTSSLGSTFEIRIGTTPTIKLFEAIDSVCSSTNLQYTSLFYSETTGNPTEYFIDWDETANNALLEDQRLTANKFEEGVGIIQTIEIPANVPGGTYTGNLFIRDGASCERSYPVSITICDPAQAPTITLSTSAINVCSKTNDQSAPLDYSTTTGNPTTYSIVWDSSPANTFAAVVDEELPVNSIKIIIPAGTAGGTYTGTLTVKNASGSSSTGSVFNVKIAGPTIVTSGTISAVCASTSSQNATLAYSAAIDSPTRYFINWDATANAALLQDQFGTDFAFNPNGGVINTIAVSANAKPGTYSGIMTIFGASCTVAQPVSITINETPKVLIIGEITPPTAEVPTGSIALSGFPSGIWSLVQLKESQEELVAGGIGDSVVLERLSPGDYAFRVINTATNCSSGYTETVTVPASSAKDAPTNKDIVDSESTGNTISVSIDNKVINVNTFKQKINQVSVYDVSGNLLYNRDGVGDSKLSIDNLRSSNQVLLVRVVLDNNRVENKKVIY
jgi:hypothetical protein